MGGGGGTDDYGDVRGPWQGDRRRVGVVGRYSGGRTSTGQTLRRRGNTVIASIYLVGPQHYL
eukprot:SAG31_NODE_1707_length_7484_cov_8.798104_6_plen_62_part_00